MAFWAIPAVEGVTILPRGYAPRGNPPYRCKIFRTAPAMDINAASFYPGRSADRVWSTSSCMVP